MDKDTSKRVRLTMDQRMRAIAYIARGDTISQVAAHILEDFNIKITESALYRIKYDNAETIAKMQERLADSIAADLEGLVRQSHIHIARKLQKAERDSSELEVLDQQYRAGEIDKSEYQRRKAGLLTLSINELSTLSSRLVAQQHTAATPPEQPERPALAANNSQALPAGASTPAQLEAMLNAIQTGNTVELQRIIFTPGGAK